MVIDPDRKLLQFSAGEYPFVLESLPTGRMRLGAVVEMGARIQFGGSGDDVAHLRVVRVHAVDPDLQYLDGEYIVTVGQAEELRQTATMLGT
ncbi:MAG TPA: hypothetical protein VFQ53_04565 [Kofleriaceae bacterium]|nr:hypothetical protein [Kofleriaceae bacterium]